MMPTQPGPPLLGFRIGLSHLSGFVQVNVKPGSSWNLSISFSTPGKSWNLVVGPLKSWKIKSVFDRSVTEDDKARTM